MLNQQEMPWRTGTEGLRVYFVRVVGWGTCAKGGFIKQGLKTVERKLNARFPDQFSHPPPVAGLCHGCEVLAEVLGLRDSGPRAQERWGWRSSRVESGVALTARRAACLHAAPGDSLPPREEGRGVVQRSRGRRGWSGEMPVWMRMDLQVGVEQGHTTLGACPPAAMLVCWPCWGEMGVPGACVCGGWATTGRRTSTSSSLSRRPGCNAPPPAGRMRPSQTSLAPGLHLWASSCLPCPSIQVLLSRCPSFGTDWRTASCILSCSQTACAGPGDAPAAPGRSLSPRGLLWWRCNRHVWLCVLDTGDSGTMEPDSMSGTGPAPGWLSSHCVLTGPSGGMLLSEVSLFLFMGAPPSWLDCLLSAPPPVNLIKPPPWPWELRFNIWILRGCSSSDRSPGDLPSSEGPCTVSGVHSEARLCWSLSQWPGSCDSLVSWCPLGAPAPSAASLQVLSK